MIRRHSRARRTETRCPYTSLIRAVGEFGEDGWQDHWQALRDNDVEGAAGWEEAYYGSFSGAAGSPGDRPIVVSYASSPAAEVIFAEEPLEADRQRTRLNSSP